MNIVLFRAEHAKQLTGEDISPDLDRLEGRKSYTVMVDGRPVFCGGVVEHWPGRCVVWALVGAQTHRHWKSVHTAVRNFLKALDARRIEADVRFDFPAGHRWAERLGFKVDAPRKRSFFPDGSDAVGYALVKEA